MFRTVCDDRFAVTEDFLVSIGPLQGEQNVAFAILSDGRFIASWTDTDGVRAQVFDGNGRRVEGEFLLASGGSGMSLAALPSGGFIATWTMESAFPAVFDVQVRTFDAAGQPLGPVLIANTTTDGLQTNPVIAVLAGGGFVVCWEDAQSTGFDHIRAQVFAANGIKVGTEFAVTDARPGDKLAPTIVALAGGGFVVSWFEWGAETDPSGNLSPGSRAQLFDASGNKVGSAFALNSLIPGYQQSPTIAALASGGFVAAYADDGGSFSGTDTGHKGIWVQLFDANGQRIGSEIRASSLGPIGQDLPVIEVVPGTGFFVIWKDGNSTNEASAGHMRAQLFDLSGNKLGAEFAINPGLEGGQNPTAAAYLGNGSLIVGWTNFAPVMGSWGDSVRARMLLPIEHGTEGPDSLSGNDDRDFIMGHGGNDNIFGGGEDDGLDGGDGDDLLEGGAGNDQLYGGTGNDTLRGGAGDDLVDGGAGVDRINYGDALAGITVNLATGVAGSISSNAGIGTDQLVNIEHIVGSDFADMLTGGDAAETLIGGSGNDTLKGGAGADVLDGGLGDDRIYYDPTDNALSVIGGVGSDTLVVLGSLALPSDNLAALGFEYVEVRRSDTGANPWSEVVSVYTASWGLLSQTTTNDDGSLILVEIDAANTAATSQVWSSFDAQGRLSSVDQLFDNGTRTFINADETGANPWVQNWFNYDALGRLDSQDVLNDNGTRTFINFDQAGTQGFIQDWFAYDAQGRLDSQDVYHDNGSRTFINLDQDNSQSWRQAWFTYDAQGRLDSQDVLHDNGSRTFTNYDQAGTEPFTLAAFLYNPDGSAYQQVTVWDNGTTTYTLL